MNGDDSNAERDETGSEFVTPGAGKAAGSERLLDDEIGLPAVQAIGGLAGGTGDDAEAAQTENP